MRRARRSPNKYCVPAFARIRPYSPEHLAHLGRGDEVAGRAERVAGHVAAVLGIGQRLGHVVGEADRPEPGDAAHEALAERGHGIPVCFTSMAVDPTRKRVGERMSR